LGTVRFAGLGYRMTLGRLLRTASCLLLFGVAQLGCSTPSELPPLADFESEARLPGKFVWHNLITADPVAARHFYGELFGWDFKVEDEGAYSVITYRGRNLGGIVDATKRRKKPKRAVWLTAVSVADLDASLRAIEVAGGTQLETPVEVPGIGRVVTVTDAGGALLHLLSPSKADPPDRDPAVNEWLWHELLANDLAGALRFYQVAFGYDIKEIERESGGSYHVLWSADRPRAAILENPFDDVRSTWIPYVRVADPGAAAERAAELGGEIIIRPQPEIRNGTLAFVLDPSGAPVALQKWSPSTTPAEVLP
jgi:predicted enzyme related to lactoylglutathione lyase